MKTRLLVSILILVVVLMFLVGSCATGKKAYVVQEDEELFGTWINPDYEEKMVQSAKLIFEPDGVLRGFATANTTKEPSTSKYTITDKWIDDKGNIWYKFLITEMKFGVISHPDSEKYYYLCKISDSGRILEFSRSGYDYPPEVNPDNLRYPTRVYYRQ